MLRIEAMEFDRRMNPICRKWFACRLPFVLLSQRSRTMDIALHAKVDCTDGECGQIADLVVDPRTDQVTHVVVDAGWLDPERLVPIAWVRACSLARVALDHSRAELEQADAYMETHALDEWTEDDQVVTYALWPLNNMDAGVILLQHKNIPKGELELSHSARVFARDGRVGKVDALLVHPKSGEITHLVLREGHLWGKRDVTIPVAEIERIEDNTVYLTLTKRAVESLPAVPVRPREEPSCS
jgi:sporulation protein YlmC with PRC-barrel domain